MYFFLLPILGQEVKYWPGNWCRQVNNSCLKVTRWTIIIPTYNYTQSLVLEFPFKSPLFLLTRSDGSLWTLVHCLLSLLEVLIKLFFFFYSKTLSLLFELSPTARTKLSGSKWFESNYLGLPTDSLRQNATGEREFIQRKLYVMAKGAGQTKWQIASW